jgi:hypothetical protein
MTDTDTSAPKKIKHHTSETSLSEAFPDMFKKESLPCIGRLQHLTLGDLYIFDDPAKWMDIIFPVQDETVKEQFSLGPFLYQKKIACVRALHYMMECIRKSDRFANIAPYHFIRQ